jgi:integrase
MDKMENQETIQLYLQERRANALSEQTIRLDRMVLERLAEFLKKPFRQATKQDLVRYFSKIQETLSNGTVHLEKVKTKQFYNWLYDLEPKDFPDCVKWIRPTNPGKGMLPIQPEDLLTREEIRKLIDACSNARNQALISSLYETAARAEEILDLKIKNVNFDEQGAVVSLKGKTGQRRIRVVESVPYLQTWINIHPFKNNPNSTLWYSNRSRSGLSYNYLYSLLRQSANQAGVKKKVTPHILRHTRLTELAKHLPEQKLKVFAGWTPSSRMASVYVHLSGKDLDSDILSLHGLQKEEAEAPFKDTPLTPAECPRCHKKNPATAKHCQFCGMILDEKQALELMETQKELEEKLKKREEEQHQLEEKVHELEAQLARTDPLLKDIQLLSEIPEWKSFLNDMVKDAKAKFTEKLKLEEVK